MNHKPPITGNPERIKRRKDAKANGDKFFMWTCNKHGETWFYTSNNECKKCKSKQNAEEYRRCRGGGSGSVSGWQVI